MASSRKLREDASRVAMSKVMRRAQERPGRRARRIKEHVVFEIELIKQVDIKSTTS
jgi:hypothetical protein